MAGKKKLALLMAGLFTIFCIFGSFMTSNEKNMLRQLKDNNTTKNKTDDFNSEKRVNVPFIIEKDYTIRHKKEIEMKQKTDNDEMNGIKLDNSEKKKKKGCCGGKGKNQKKMNNNDIPDVSPNES